MTLKEPLRSGRGLDAIAIVPMAFDKLSVVVHEVSIAAPDQVKVFQGIQQDWMIAIRKT
jgi:hypothetical protein